jgi:hypothetical protein
MFLSEVEQNFEKLPFLLSPALLHFQRVSCGDLRIFYRIIMIGEEFVPAVLSSKS